MDSPRNGLFSTLIMTLPLIVVPAIALLRPPAPDSGVSSGELAASDDAGNLDGFDEILEGDFSEPGGFNRESDYSSEGGGSRDSEASAFREIFPDEPGTSTSASRAPRLSPADSEAPPFREPPPETASQQDRMPTAATPDLDPDWLDPAHLPEHTPGTGITSIDDENTLLQRVQDQGSVRTLWFSPGAAGQAGFVAFFQGEEVTTTYRFEAVGATRSDAVLRVLAQIDRWKARRLSGSRAGQ